MKNFEVDKILITGEAPVLQSDLGIQPNQIPLNKDLGSLAYMDAPQLEDVNVDTLKLREMAAEISDDIVDVFIYDTNNDSDGGKWRERTSHTSWYNEGLNTATRGSRREFPAVAVIVAEASKVTIYDGDDPDLSMWMVFEATQSGYTTMLRSGNINSVSMLNGEFWVSHQNGSGVHWINFLKDTSRWITQSTGYGGYFKAGTIDKRNISTVGNYDQNVASASNLVIVSADCNDVAMTVLPNAPIDDDTGLPVPTIAVATDGGVSVIKDDGSVVDITSSQGSSYNYSRFVSFDNNNKLLFGMDSSTRNTSRRVHWHDIPNSDKTIDVNGITSELYTTNATNSDVPDAVGEDQAFALNGAVAGSLGLTKVERDDNRFAFITSTYNTGWMPGDIKLATLSDTKAEVMGGLGEELITNGTFDTDVSGWTLIDPTANPDATITWNNGVAEIFRPNGQGARFYQAFNTIIGREYAVSAGVNVGGYYIADSIDSSSWNILANDGNVISDTSVHRFFATSNVTYFVLNSNAVNASHPFDNISAKQTGELITNGTFDNGTEGWDDNSLGTGSVVYDSGTGMVKLTRIDGSNNGVLAQGMSLLAGKRYVLSFDTGSIVTSSIQIRGYTSSTTTTGSIIENSLAISANSSFMTTFVAEVDEDGLEFRAVSATNTYIYLDNISVRLAEEDRSVNDNGLQIFGEIDKTPVAPGADLVAYSGFSADDYLMQPYNPDLDFGTGDFCIMGWFKNANASGNLLSRILPQVAGTIGTDRGFMVGFTNSNKLRFSIYTQGFNSEQGRAFLDSDDNQTEINTWTHFVVTRDGGQIKFYFNGKKQASETANSDDISDNTISIPLSIGCFNEVSGYEFTGSTALIRVSATAPTPEQIAKIYRDEKVLFQDGAQATLYGTSDSVTALAYDDKTELLHVGTASGRSDFNGLRRVNNTTTAVTTAISANNKLIAEQ